MVVTPSARRSQPHLPLYSCCGWELINHSIVRPMTHQQSRPQKSAAEEMLPRPIFSATRKVWRNWL
jgi:hypothetical protein